MDTLAWGCIGMLDDYLCTIYAISSLEFDSVYQPASDLGCIF
jgi:hypothetical protein